MPFATVVPLPRSEGQIPDAGCLTCRLLILRKNDSEILVLRKNRGDQLPAAHVPRMQRIAPRVVAAVRSQFGLLATCRFLVSCNPSELECSIVLELTEGDLVPDADAIWLPVREISWERIEPAAAREPLWTALARLTAYDAGHLDGRFVRPGCFAEITAWVGQSVESRGLRLGNSWTQFAMGPDFSLFSFATDGPRVWFKATGEPNLREFRIASILARLQMPHVPEVIATREDWNAWLMLDAGGGPLDGDADEACWKAAARSLGELQLASVPHVDELAKSGCEDLRLPCLRTRIEPFLSDLAVLMEAQTTIPPTPLGPDDLRRIGRYLQAAFSGAGNLGLPDTLGHSDVSPGNILANEQGAVFLDWMQGHIGHPFLTFEYLLALARRIAATRPIAFDAVRREYLECWRPFRSLRDLERAFDLVPLIALFAYAVTVSGNGSIESARPELAGLIRSLGRRMHFVAERLDQVHGPRSRV